LRQHARQVAHLLHHRFLHADQIRVMPADEVGHQCLAPAPVIDVAGCLAEAATDIETHHPEWLLAGNRAERTRQEQQQQHPRHQHPDACARTG
jgi:hypothetical protein